MTTKNWFILQITDTTEKLFRADADGTVELGMRSGDAPAPEPVGLPASAELQPQGTQRNPSGDAPRATRAVNDLASVRGTTETYYQRVGQAVKQRIPEGSPLFVAIDSGRVAFFDLNAGLPVTAYIDGRGADPTMLWKQTRQLLEDSRGRLLDTAGTSTS
jgi:hypothetical protein